jgi:hypothetical protein
MRKCVPILAASILFALPPAVLRAATMDTFTLTSGADIASFSLPSSPTPNSSFTNLYFVLDSITVTIDGVQTLANIVFYNSGAEGGGLDITSAVGGTDLIDQHGPLLFGNSTAAPVFLLNATPEQLTNYVFGFPPVGNETYAENFSIVVAPAALSATPEPSSFTLLVSGLLGFLGVAGRRRFRQACLRHA